MRVEPGQDKSHTYCKRHYIAMMRLNLEMPEIDNNPEMANRIHGLIDQARARPDDSFPPDLSQHPELVGAPVRDQREQEREALRRETMQRLQR